MQIKTDPVDQKFPLCVELLS